MNRLRFLLITLLQLAIKSVSAQSFPEIASKLPLFKLDSSVNGFHWRLWANQGYGVQSVIQIDQSNNASFKGKVILYAVEAVDVEKEGPTNRVYSAVKDMKPAQVAKIIDFLKINQINQIPTDRAIEGWDLGVDGVVYTIEHVDSGRYQTKSYWTPSELPKLKEAVMIQRLVDTAESILNIPASAKQFSYQIPFESWVGGMIIIKRNVSWLTKRRLRRERNAYRKRMHMEQTP